MITARIEHSVASVTYAPHRLEITCVLGDDVKRLEIELTTTFHNLYSSIHVAAEGPTETSPESLDKPPRRNRQSRRSRPALVQFGLLGGANLETYDPEAKEQEISNQEEPEEQLPPLETHPE